MKKSIVILLFVLVFSLLLIPIFHHSTYTIKVEMIDDFSPDRKLTVYKDRKVINFKELQYMDGTYLCSSKNPTVSYSEIAKETKLIIKISDKKKVVAKIVEK